MATERIVYVHTEAAKIESDAVEVITPRTLNDLLDDGWAVAERSTAKVGKRTVDVYRLKSGKSAPRRDVAVVRRKTVEDGAGRSLSVRANAPNAGNAIVVPPRGGSSFLGAGSDFSGLPGLAVAGSVVVGHAFSMGADAAHAGASQDDCPFGEADGRSMWLEGYTKALREMGRTEDPVGGTDDAYAAGKRAANLPEDAEVTCPYPKGTPSYRAWLRGFEEHGGRVE